MQIWNFRNQENIFVELEKFKSCYQIDKIFIGLAQRSALNIRSNRMFIDE